MVNLTTTHHSFAANNVTTKTTVKTQKMGQTLQGPDMLTRDPTRPDPTKIGDPVPANNYDYSL